MSALLLLSAAARALAGRAVDDTARGWTSWAPAPEANAAAALGGPPPSSQTLCHDSACNGNGKCVAGKCECEPMWAGTFCTEFVTAKAISMEPSQIAQEDAQQCPMVSGFLCAGHGTCQESICMCSKGWSGGSCDVQLSCIDGCNSPSGRCVDGVCECEKDFKGPSCAERRCTSDCWGHGLCSLGQCQCYAGWVGSDCSSTFPAPAPEGWPSEPGPDGPQPFNTPLAHGDGSYRPAPRPSRSLLQLHSGPKKQRDPQVQAAMEAAHRAVVAAGALDLGLKRLSKAPTPQPAAKAPLQQQPKAKEVVRQAPPAMPRSMVRVGVLGRKSASQSKVSVGHLRRSKVRVGRLGGKAASAPPLRNAPLPAQSVGQPATEACPEGCSGHGACGAGGCDCQGGWSGEACDLPPCPYQCTAHGTCLMGTCVCGQAFYGSACELHRCPADCSGHGDCNDGKCACEVGYEGFGCELPTKELPGAVPTFEPEPVKRVDMGAAMAKLKPQAPPICPEDCNGFGKCNDNGMCRCFSGYSGVACENFCPNLCSGRGECTDGQCLCLAGWGGVDCSIKTCCSGHGQCPMPGTCVCDKGWMGEQCGIAMQCADPECSSHGKCEQGECDCDPGWTGDVCDGEPKECGHCPAEGECDRAAGVCMCGAAPCEDDGGGAIGGGKKDGGAGDSGDGGGGGGGSPQLGEQQQIGPKLDKTKSEEKDGADADGKEIKEPDCNTPNGKWNATTEICVCEHMWHGERCELQHCAGWDEEKGTVDCNGNGMCLKGQCLCAAGWGRKEPGEMDCVDRVCEFDCGEHGECQDGECVCQHGWQGPICRLPACENECSGHGLCTFVTPDSPGQCNCDYAWAGSDCSRQAFWEGLPTCPNDCSGNGLCFNGRCVCTEGFKGLDCSERLCADGRMGPKCELASCPRDCVGKGLCLGGTCVCDAGHTAVDCSMPVMCYDACKDVCLNDLASERCEFCKGSCITLKLPGVIGHHNPFSDIV